MCKIQYLNSKKRTSVTGKKQQISITPIFVSWSCHVSSAAE